MLPHEAYHARRTVASWEQLATATPSAEASTNSQSQTRAECPNEDHIKAIDLSTIAAVDSTTAVDSTAAVASSSEAFALTPVVTLVNPKATESDRPSLHTFTERSSPPDASNEPALFHFTE